MHEILYSVIKNKMKQCKVKDPSVCFLQYVMGKVFFFFFFLLHASINFSIIRAQFADNCSRLHSLDELEL